MYAHTPVHIRYRLREACSAVVARVESKYGRTPSDTARAGGAHGTLTTTPELTDRRDGPC